jgi:leucyl-tRNA synthetase
MAVPAHDERDFEFAKKYNIMVVPTVFSEEYKEKYEEFLMTKEREKLLDYEKNIFSNQKPF